MLTLSFEATGRDGRWGFNFYFVWVAKRGGCAVLSAPPVYLTEIRTMSATASITTSALRRAGADHRVLRVWEALAESVRVHQRLLAENGIAVERDARRTIQVNANRVGLQPPPFSDHTHFSFQNLFKRSAQ